MEGLNESLLNAKVSVAGVMETSCPVRIALEYQRLDQVSALYVDFVRNVFKMCLRKPIKIWRKLKSFEII